MIGLLCFVLVASARPLRGGMRVSWVSSQYERSSQHSRNTLEKVAAVGFCKDGPGLLLADAFDRELNDFPGRIPRPRAGGSTLNLLRMTCLII